MAPPIERFPYVESDPAVGLAGALPYMPVTPGHEQREISVSGLVDSGATLNVLPYDVCGAGRWKAVSAKPRTNWEWTIIRCEVGAVSIVISA